MTAVMTLVLDTTTKSIEVVMSAAAATTNPDFTSSYADDTGGAFTEGTNDGTLNGVSAVTLVAAPGSSTQRIVRTITIQNRDTAAVTLTIRLNNNTTLRQIQVVTLNPNETWTTDGTFDANGALKCNITYTQGITLSSYDINAGVYSASTSIGLQSASSGSVLFFPVNVPQYVAARHMNMVLSESFMTGGTSVYSNTGKFYWGLYTRQTGSQSSNLSLFTSSSLSWGVSYTNSTISVSQATTTNDTGYGYLRTNSNGLNITSGYTGLKLFQFLLLTTLPPNDYFLGFMQIQSTAGFNSVIRHSLLGVSATMSALAPMGSFSSAYSSGTNRVLGIGGPWPNLAGSWTAANQTNLPVSVAISAITFAASLVPYISFGTTA